MLSTSNSSVASRSYTSCGVSGSPSMLTRSPSSVMSSPAPPSSTRTIVDSALGSRSGSRLGAGLDSSKEASSSSVASSNGSGATSGSGRGRASLRLAIASKALPQRPQRTVPWAARKASAVTRNRV
jgi:hypothetical protein